MKLLIIISVCFYIPLLINGNRDKCKFSKIYQLGDSISDTGNFIREAPLSAFAKPPYGRDLKEPRTGRCSNGLLIIDYIAMALALPQPPPPYEDKTADFTKYGANFAVAGSTALPAPNSVPVMTRSSLDVQLSWMSDYLYRVCSTTDCAEMLENALFMVGEIGGNDYNHAMLNDKKPVNGLEGMVTDVVDAILRAVRTAISLGAKTVAVPGNFPVGCFPVIKAAFDTNDPEAYDKHNCLTELNKFAAYHNQQLQRGIKRLMDEEKPNVLVVYADYYNAYNFALRNFTGRGFETQKACCGMGGNYNYNAWNMCGSDYVTACADADKYLSWDGVHLTQEAYKMMAAYLINDLFHKFGCQT